MGAGPGSRPRPDADRRTRALSVSREPLGPRASASRFAFGPGLITVHLLQYRLQLYTVSI